MRILIVEDYSDTADVLVRLFRHRGHLVMVAETAKDALLLCDGNEFDLLISDIGLPDCNGWDLLRQVRQCCCIKAIALSGFASAEDQKKSAAAGFEAHLIKPIDFGVLLQTVARVMGSTSGPSRRK
jgi:CheY-like chemotaxis protein